MSRLYDYCTTNRHTKQFINDLFTETYKHTEKLLKAWRRNGHGVLAEEFYPNTYVNKLWGILTTKCYENCSIYDVWEVFNDLTTDISQRLTNQIDIIIGMPPGCAVYFGINRLHEGILMVGDQTQLVLSYGPAFQIDGLQSIR